MPSIIRHIDYQNKLAVLAGTNDNIIKVIEDIIFEAREELKLNLIPREGTYKSGDYHIDYTYNKYDKQLFINDIHINNFRKNIT